MSRDERIRGLEHLALNGDAAALERLKGEYRRSDAGEMTPLVAHLVPPEVGFEQTFKFRGVSFLLRVISGKAMNILIEQSEGDCPEIVVRMRPF